MNEQRGTSGQERNHVTWAKQHVLAAMRSQQRRLLPQSRRKRRGEHDVDGSARQANVLRDRLRRINPYLLEGVVQVVHPAKNGFDATRDPGSIPDKSNAINSQNHCGSPDTSLPDFSCPVGKTLQRPRIEVPVSSAIE